MTLIAEDVFVLLVDDVSDRRYAAAGRVAGPCTRVRGNPEDSAEAAAAVTAAVIVPAVVAGSS